MNTTDHFPAREDKMTHEAQLIEATLSINHYEIKGKPDRRFKSGWRVMPEVGHNTIVEFKLAYDERYRIGEIWSIFNRSGSIAFGSYAVSFIDRINGQVAFIPCTISQNRNITCLIVTEKLKMICIGFTVWEGSINIKK